MKIKLVAGSELKKKLKMGKKDFFLKKTKQNKKKMKQKRKQKKTKKQTASSHSQRFNRYRHYC